MTVNEVFSEIEARQLEGIMLHNDLTQAFDFLNLHGFKRMHEFQYFSESAEMRSTQRYYINHYSRLLKCNETKPKNVIPDSWYNHIRTDVDVSTKKTAIKNFMETWVSWERDTKKIYERCYSELCNLTEIASSIKVKELICDVDAELKYAERLHIKLLNLSYDLPSIYLMQDELHEEYRKKEEDKLHIAMC